MSVPGGEVGNGGEQPDGELPHDETTVEQFAHDLGTHISKDKVYRRFIQNGMYESSPHAGGKADALRIKLTAADGNTYAIDTRSMTQQRSFKAIYKEGGDINSHLTFLKNQTAVPSLTIILERPEQDPHVFYLFVPSEAMGGIEGYLASQALRQGRDPDAPVLFDETSGHAFSGNDFPQELMPLKDLLTKG